MFWRLGFQKLLLGDKQILQAGEMSQPRSEDMKESIIRKGRKRTQ
jgi:hypothetical protein